MRLFRPSRSLYTPGLSGMVLTYIVLGIWTIVVLFPLYWMVITSFKTPIQVNGVSEEPFDPISTAIALDASFVARAYIGDVEGTKEILKKAMTHRGFSIVDIFQPCVSFNKLNTHKWFKEHTYKIEEGYDPHDRANAFRRALEADPMPLGIIYVNENKTTFEDNLKPYKQDKTPLFKRAAAMETVEKLLREKR